MVVVRFNLETNGESVTDIYYTGIFTRTRNTRLPSVGKVRSTAFECL